tara:strand:- start:272 stop:931 length:660 start_codon:yes stop_codon:yes gene_type:complete
MVITLLILLAGRQLMEQAMFVTAARIAAHLYFATKVAKSLSLTAKNARAITARAGQQASGFTALTAFIQDLSSNTITLAQQVNVVAVKISMCTTQLERALYANVQFFRAQELAHDAEYIDSISSGILKTHQRQSVLIQTFITLRFKLDSLIEDTRKQIRFAEVIATMSKVEASKSGDFEAQLNVIAGNILLASNQIRHELECAESLLSSSNMELTHESN